MSIVEHTTRRLVVAVPGSYHDVIARYESLVPEVDYAALTADDGFRRYHRGDVDAVMTATGVPWRATQYLMGNHAIAARMYRHDPAVMLHAPLRTLVYAGADGATTFTVDQPSSLFDSYSRPEISVVGRYLDDLLDALIGQLTGES
ncbi:hypothetical protein MPNTM1_01481 [Mycolicibacterium parafortuitum]|uniref:DUF302 domain-containing protein n=1 Tax=Mycolicibacterium parafortuitum TaxID=39692 RepID=UPI0032C4459E